MTYATISDFERDIFDLEGIRVLIRADSATPCQPYPYSERVCERMTVQNFLALRVQPLTEHKAVAIDPRMCGLNPNTTVGRLRSVYEQAAHAAHPASGWAPPA